MKTATLHENNASTIEWKVFALGFTLGAAGASDFTAAGTTQTFVLDQLQAGDIVLSHLVRVDQVKAVGHAATWSVQVGVTGDTDRFIVNTDIKPTSLNGDTLVPSSATLADLNPYVRANSADIDLIATITVGSSTVAATTSGEIWITIPIIRRTDRVTKRGSF